MRHIREWIVCKWENLTLQRRLTLLFMMTAAIILFTNLYIYSMINSMTGQVEKVYVSNVSLNELNDTLDRVHGSMEEYLNTKSSDALETYYRSDQEYRELLDELNTQTTDDPILLAQKNIRNLSLSYLDLADEVIQAKRSRNVERYGKLYEDAAALSEEIHAWIYSLNNEQFKANSTSYQFLRDSMETMEMVSMAALFIVLLGSMSLLIVSTGRMIRPLHQLAESAGEVAKGNFGIEKLPVRNRDEIGIVSEAFNHMIDSIRNYIEELKLTLERENELKERELMMQNHLQEAQLKYFQAQINPHFLFNTLNAGAQLAMMEDAEATGKFLENTAEFFRYNVKNNKDVTLGEEIHLVDNYVYILNVRFSGEILFTKEIDESLLDVRVPGMILQPVVENAVNYGIRGLEREGRIELSAYRKDGTICISVWDNGAGMEEERIRQVLSGQAQTEKPQSDSNGVGLKNVMERLRLYFHGEAKLEIFSEGRGMGTEVLLTIPGEEKFGSKLPNLP